MIRFDIPATTRTVLDLLNEMREGRLDLNPEFQRRSVWRAVEKSHLIDTVLRGLPIPLILLRRRTDPDTKSGLLEVADGQQRLRTLFSFIEPEVLGKELDPKIDFFTVRKAHNKDPAIYGQSYSDLPKELRQALLDYRLNVVFLPTSMEDRDVLDLFARLNSTGLRLTPQELRNANFSGDFKSLMYRLARENLERWRAWGVLTAQDIARMKDAELVSDIANLVLNGLRRKTKKELDDLYEKYDEDFALADEVERRINALLAEIDRNSTKVVHTAFSREMHFYVLCAALYDRMWGLGSPMDKRKAKSVAKSFWAGVEQAAERYESGDLPKPVIEATQGAATDKERRRTRFDFLISQVDGG